MQSNEQQSEASQCQMKQLLEAMTEQTKAFNRVADVLTQLVDQNQTILESLAAPEDEDEPVAVDMAGRPLPKR